MGTQSTHRVGHRVRHFQQGWFGEVTEIQTQGGDHPDLCVVKTNEPTIGTVSVPHNQLVAFPEKPEKPAEKKPG